AVLEADLGSDDAKFLLDEAEGHELLWYGNQEGGPLLEMMAPGRDDPRCAPNSSHTYRTMGRYGTTGCKTWLVVVWRLLWYIPIVFPLELRNTDQVGVQETQVVAAGRPR